MFSIFGKRKSRESIPVLVESYEGDSSRSTVVQDSQLLSLPGEILLLIANNLGAEDRFEDLCNARLVCSHVKGLVEPIFFREYRISHGQKATKLVKLLGRDTSRAAYFRDLLVSTKYDEDIGLEQFPTCLRLMRNLRSLTLETPDCNSKLPPDRVKWVELQKQYEEILQKSSVAIPREERLLPNLEDCTIHFVDDVTSLYPLTKYSSIFLHPTLKSLILSCCCTDVPSRILKDHRQYKHTTALEHVHFEECDFDPASLEILLKFPQHLKSLIMSEGTRYHDNFNSRRSRLHGNLKPPQLSHALAESVSSSLETLSLSLGHRRTHNQSVNNPNHSLDLTTLTNLKRLDLSLSTLNLLVNRSHCDHDLHRRLPPSLQTLRIFAIRFMASRGSLPIPLPTCLIRAKSAHGLPNLTRVLYTYEYQKLRGRSSFGTIQHRGEEVFQRHIDGKLAAIRGTHERCRRIYREAGLRVIAEAESTPPGFIPPYLNNEESPTRRVLWDSGDPDVSEVAGDERREEEDVEDSETESSDGDDTEVVGMAPHVQEWWDFLVMQPTPHFQL